MQLIITYKDSEDAVHEDHMDTQLDRAFLQNEQGQEEPPAESNFIAALQQFYQDCGCYHVDIKEV